MTPDVLPNIFADEHYNSSSSPSRRVEPKRGEGSARGRRGGYVMVLLAMMLFGIFAMAALVIDIGFARLAQRQMQSAADTAALEGLRGAGDPGYSYEARQEAAEDLIDWIFDDDLDASNGENGIAGTGGQFGAGPLVEFPGGAGAPELAAGQLISIYPQRTAYKPRPDMRRRLSPVTPDRFGVAIQRGGNLTDDFDLYGLGPSVPYLFARASLVDRNLIAPGISVGANVYAEGQPVVSISSDPNRVGRINLAYERSDWLRNDLSKPRFFAGHTLGDLVVDTEPNVSEVVGYAGIFEHIDTADRIIAFGYVQRSASGDYEKIQTGPSMQMPLAIVNASTAYCFPVCSDVVDPVERADVVNLVFEARAALFRVLRPSSGPDLTRQELLHAPALLVN